MCTAATGRSIMSSRKWRCISRGNLMNLRLITVLLVLVCSLLVVANCEHKPGVFHSPNQLMAGAGASRKNRPATRDNTRKPVKHDPLSLLREIYLDYNNKILTLVSLEPIGESVQKFHPNGRYGRRSVNNPDSTSHFQFGKLSANRIGGQPTLAEEEEILRELVANLLRESAAAKDQPMMKKAQLPGGLSDADASSIDFATEMSKILKCHYIGLSNLYRCDS